MMTSDGCRVSLMTEPDNWTARASDAATADDEIVNQNESCSLE